MIRKMWRKMYFHYKFFNLFLIYLWFILVFWGFDIIYYQKRKYFENIYNKKNSYQCATAMSNNIKSLLFFSLFVYETMEFHIKFVSNKKRLSKSHFQKDILKCF